MPHSDFSSCYDEPSDPWWPFLKPSRSGNTICAGGCYTITVTVKKDQSATRGLGRALLGAIARETR